MIDPSYIYTQNRRMDAIAKAVGVDSKIYQDQVNKIKRAIPPEFTRQVNGVLHMVKPGKMEQAGLTFGSIPVIKTWGDIRKGYKEGWQSWVQEPENEGKTLNDYIRSEQQLIEDMPLLYGKSEKAQRGLEIMQITGRRKTWDEIAEVKVIQSELKGD